METVDWTGRKCFRDSGIEWYNWFNCSWCFRDNGIQCFNRFNWGDASEIVILSDIVNSKGETGWKCLKDSGTKWYNGFKWRHICWII